MTDIFNPADPFDIVWAAFMLAGLGAWLCIFLLRSRHYD